MNWIAETLAEFGRQLGLSAFGLNAQGVAQLRLESGGLLAVEAVRRGQADEILITLGQPLGFEADRLRRRALEKVHCSQGGAYALQVAVRGEGAQALLLMVIRMPDRSFTPQALGQAVDCLDRCFADLRRG